MGMNFECNIEFETLVRIIAAKWDEEDQVPMGYNLSRMCDETGDTTR